MIVPQSSHFQERTYDMHGMFELRVRSPSHKVIRYFDAEFGPFRSGGARVPDLEVIVDRFYIAPEARVCLSGRSSVLEDGICGSDRYKVARWRFAIEGLDHKPTRLYLIGGHFSLGFMQHRYVDQLMRYKLSLQGCTMVHGCCVAHQGSAVLFPGLMHTGKTTIALYFVLHGWQFQADDYTIVDADGWTYSYPRRLHFSCHVSERYPEALESIGPRHRLSMVAKKAIYLLTMGYGNISEALSIAEIVPDVEIADLARLRHLILLSRHTGERLMGPIPLSPSDAVDRVLSINCWEGGYLRNILLEWACVRGNNPLVLWRDRERRVLEEALRRTACYELLIPQQVRDLKTLFTQISSLIEQMTGLSPARSPDAETLESDPRSDGRRVA
jgi:hypothetical protein